MPEVHKSISMAQRKRDPHAGPGLSYPLDPEHIAAAWDEAGHSPEADEIRRKVINYARSTGHMDLLPDSAHAWARAHGGDLVKKATGPHQRELLAYAYNNNQYSDIGKREMIEWAQREGISGDLPDEAHGFMHANNMPHVHSEGDHPFHAHPVHKAFNPEGVDILIQKSWTGEDGNTYFEGWVSPGATKDKEKEITPPEAFSLAIKSYFQRGAPISSEHDMKRYPVGHVQKAALIRDGKTFQQELHPVDPAEFEHLEEALADGPVTTGTYIRGALTEDPARSMVRKGNVRGLSWIGNVTKVTPLPGGGRELTEVNPLWEMTVAAYPVHKDAAILIAKAYTGLEEHMDFEEMIRNMVAESVKNALPASDPTPAPAPAPQPESQAQKAFSVEDVAGIVAKALADQQKQFSEQIDERVQKAITLHRGEPARGSKQERTPEDEMRDDPIAYLAKKGATAKSADDFTDLEKQLIWAGTSAVLGKGLRGSDEDDDE